MGRGKKVRSKEPYEVHTCTIGEIIAAKAASGDEKAKNVIEKMVKGEEKNGKANSHFRRSKQDSAEATRG